jgi:2-hydroxychromene-2-carboxylate isomerase
MEPVFYFDFGSPNAYLAHRVIPAIEQRTGVRFRYVPVLLGGLFKLTGNRAPMVAFAEVPAKLAYQKLEMQRFITRHGLTAFQMNPNFPVNTLGLMRGAVAAEAEGVLAAYVEAMFGFMWEAGLNLDDPAVIAEAVVDAGLPTNLLELAQNQLLKDRLAANTQQAAARGVFGIPSFLVGDALFFGKDSLGDVEYEINAQRG